MRNLSDQRAHGLVLELEETFYPYDPGGTSVLYSYPVQLSPALTATLPGQINLCLDEGVVVLVQGVVEAE